MSLEFCDNGLNHKKHPAKGQPRDDFILTEETFHGQTVKQSSVIRMSCTYITLFECGRDEKPIETKNEDDRNEIFIGYGTKFCQVAGRSIFIVGI